MNKKLIIRNLLMSLILQLLTLVNGLIIPRLILGAFGSEVNGLAASISQFLNYITIVEGGISGVAMAALYKALASNDDLKVSRIIKAIDVFFKKVALIFLVYSLALSIVYPFIVKTNFDYPYLISLTLIIAIGTFIQYFFSLTYKILIQADRRGYIVSIANIFFLFINLIFSYVSIKFYPSIHLLKAINILAFTAQPIIYRLYVNKKYKLNKQCDEDKNALKDKWSSFGQNIAYFIHYNSPIVILTFIGGLGMVSVFSVYFALINAVKTLLGTISTAVQPTFGNLLATRTKHELNAFFDDYELLNGFLSGLLFTICALVIVPFVSVYTQGITDANYIRPIFAYLLTIGEAIFVYRNTYISVAYAAGEFKKTAKYAYIESILNIIISLLLTIWLGLVGVAIGLIVSMGYRMIMHVYYLKKNILFRPITKFLKSFIVFSFSGVVSFFLVSALIKIEVTNYLNWFYFAVTTGIITFIVYTIFTFVFYRDNINNIRLKYFYKGVKK